MKIVGKGKPNSYRHAVRELARVTLWPDLVALGGILLFVAVAVGLGLFVFRDKVGVELTSRVIGNATLAAPEAELVGAHLEAVAGRFITWAVLVGLIALAFLAVCVVLLAVVRLLVEALRFRYIIPHSPWALEYLASKARYERRLAWPLTALAALTILGFAAWAFPNIDRIEDQQLLSVGVLLMIVLAGVVIAVDFVAMHRFGLLALVRRRAPRPAERIRVFASPFVVISAQLLFGVLALFSVEPFLLQPVDAVTRDLRNEVLVAHRSLENAVAELDETSPDLDILLEHDAELVDSISGYSEPIAPLIETLRTAALRLFAGVFLITLCIQLYFPFLYSEVRSPLPFFVLLVASLVALELALRWVLRETFGDFLTGATLIVSLVVATLVLGHLGERVLRSLVETTEPCPACGHGNVGSSHFCAQCGVETQSHARAYIGSAPAARVHHATCPFVARIKPTNRVEFPELTAAVAAGYTRCGFCLTERFYRNTDALG